MKVATKFGDIEISDKTCISLDEGLVGLSEAKRFCLVTGDEESPFHWLQCLDEPAIALAVISPMDFVDDYSFELQDADVEHLGLDTADDAVVLTTVTVDEDHKRVTTNLLGPIIVNRNTLKGRQVVLSYENFETKHAPFESKPAKSSKSRREVAKAA